MSKTVFKRASKINARSENKRRQRSAATVTTVRCRSVVTVRCRRLRRCVVAPMVHREHVVQLANIRLHCVTKKPILPLYFLSPLPATFLPGSCRSAIEDAGRHAWPVDVDFVKKIRNLRYILTGYTRDSYPPAPPRKYDL